MKRRDLVVEYMVGPLMSSNHSSCVSLHPPTSLLAHLRMRIPQIILLTLSQLLVEDPIPIKFLLYLHHSANLGRLSCHHPTTPDCSLIDRQKSLHYLGRFQKLVS